MVKKYVERLYELLDNLKLISSKTLKFEIKDFFSGAAAYANGKIFMTLTPVGLAIKLPEEIREKLLKGGKVRKLRYFPKAPIKKDYVVLPKSMMDDLIILRYLAKMSINNIIKEEIIYKSWEDYCI